MGIISGVPKIFENSFVYPVNQRSPWSGNLDFKNLSFEKKNLRFTKENPEVQVPKILGSDSRIPEWPTA